MRALEVRAFPRHTQEQELLTEYGDWGVATLQQGWFQPMCNRFTIGKFRAVVTVSRSGSDGVHSCSCAGGSLPRFARATDL